MRQMKEIASIMEDRGYSIHNIISDTIKKYKLHILCMNAGIIKQAGYNAYEIITLLLLLPLMSLKNVHQFYRSGYNKMAKMQKDSIYRLKNNVNYSWRSLLLSVAKRFQKMNIPDQTENDTKLVRAFILDDTLHQHTGNKIENISHVFDHTLGKTVRGFKQLVLAYFNGEMITPVDFSMHSEKKLPQKQLKKQYKKEVEIGTEGWKRRKELKVSKIEQGIVMIKRAVKHGFKAEYVLCDSWFTSLAFIQEIRGIKNGMMHVIAGIRNDKRKYTHSGELFTAKEIVNRLKESVHEKRCRSLNLRYFEAEVEYEGVGKVKLVMCRYPGQKKWHIFISTNTELGVVEMMRIYGIRWTIEIMFKEMKQFLKLGTCQSQDFDARIADTTILMILYILLAHIKYAQAYKSFGDLLRLTTDDIREKNLAERLWLLFKDLLQYMVDNAQKHDTLELSNLLDSSTFSDIESLFMSSFLHAQLDKLFSCA